MSQYTSIITSLLSSLQFKLMLRQQIAQANTYQHNEQLMKSDVVNELSDTIAVLLRFNLNNAISEEFSKIIQDNMKIKNDIEDLRQRYLKISIKFSNQEFSPSKIKWQPTKDLDFFEQQLDFQTEKLQKRNIQSLQLTKVKKQLEVIKQALLKFSNNNILQFVEETNEHLHKKIQEKYNKLSQDIQNTLNKNTDAELEKTLNSFMDTKYDVLYSRVQKCLRDLNLCNIRLDKFEKQTLEKYETSLKSVWNVITMMENSLSQNKMPQKIQKTSIFSYFK